MKQQKQLLHRENQTVEAISRRRAGVIAPLVLLFWCLLYPETAQAQALVTFLCEVVNLVQTDIGKAAATAAVIALALQAMLGRVSWGMVTITVVGMVIMFSAGEVATQISGLADPCGP